MSRRRNKGRCELCGQRPLQPWSDGLAWRIFRATRRDLAGAGYAMRYIKVRICRRAECESDDPHRFVGLFER